MERVLLALVRTRFSVLSMFLVHLLGVGVGFGMAIAGSSFALAYRDRTVTKAQTANSVEALERGEPGKAAVVDAIQNLGGSLTTMAAGYCVVGGYGIAAVRGWVGGVVGVDDNHRSRLGTQGFYYLTTVLLQILSFSLAGGAGVNIGLATHGPYFGYVSPYGRRRWLGMPEESLIDAAWLLVLAAVVGFVGSGFEFFAA